MVKNFSNKLLIKLTAGLDKIPSSFDKKYVDLLSIPLIYIFNRSKSEGVYPTLWKGARVCPLFRKKEINQISQITDPFQYLITSPRSLKNQSTLGCCQRSNLTYR